MTAPLPRILVILDQVAALCAPFASQHRNVVSTTEHDIPPRMVWFLGEARTEGGQPQGTKVSMGRDVWPLMVHCWGADDAQALRLRQAAITAVAHATVRDDESYHVVRSRLQGGEALSTDGRLATVELTVSTPLFEADLTGTEIDDAQSEFTQAQRFRLTGAAGTRTLEPPAPTPDPEPDGG